MSIFDSHPCILGEGPLWHPRTNTLFWFDILGQRLLSRASDETRSWQFDTHHSAAGWFDERSLLIASETALWRFDIQSGARKHLVALEHDDPVTRSNDGRADPWGGFWIGTMGKRAEPEAGAIYRFYRGAVRQVASKITVSNAICFAPDRSAAYYTDTITQKIMRQPLAADTGWPAEPATVFIDLSGTKLFPDGAVTDAAGNIWVAMWGTSGVVCFDPEGNQTARIEVPAKQPSCPAFGGPDLRDLYVTSATDGLDAAAFEKRPANGATFIFKDVAQGRAEPQVLL
ncbi:MAG: SMP-30/gluconolactonase/LRE family protein [Pseudomonadota bacterium]